MNALSNVDSPGRWVGPTCRRFASDAIPDAKSLTTGVSVEYVQDPEKKWYVFRASYGREDRASDFLIEDGTYVYIPKCYVQKQVKGKYKRILKTLMPNFLFVYTTPEKAEKYIKNTLALSFLSYYYNHFELNKERKNPPLTLSCVEMENFILATCNRSEHILLVEPSQCHYKGGEIVRVIDGTFKGVEGRVARVLGQQRVIVALRGVALIATAYIPASFLQIIE